MAEKEQKSPPSQYIREATGLVRTAGPWSGLAFNVIWTGNAVGLTAAFILQSYMFVSPGLNFVELILIATLLSTLNAAVYMFFSLAIPRSGGDYQYISRSLHPSLGFMSGVNWALWLPLVLGWTGSKVVPIDFQSVFVSLGVVLHNTSLITFANTLSTPNNSFVIGAIFIVAFTLITLLGNRVYFAFQTIAFAFMIVAFLITVGVFATNSPVNFSNLIDKTFGAGTYNYMIDEFSKQGGYTLRPFFTAFLSGIVLWAGINTWSLGTSMIAGEIKQANKIKTWLISNVLGAIVVGVLFAITAQLYLSSVGEKFVYAATYLSGTQYYKIVFPPYYSSFVILASPSVILSVIFAIGFFLGGIFYMPQNQIIASRMMLAFAFDRLAPAKLGEVSERFHVPVISTLIALLISLVSLWIYVYTNWLGFFSQLFAVAFSFLLTSIAAIIFPYRRRELYEHSPANKKIAGIPLMSVLGFANAIFMGAFIYENWVDSALGSNSIQSVGLITGVLVFSFVLFWVIKWVRKKQGIDVDALFREIPPE